MKKIIALLVIIFSSLIASNASNYKPERVGFGVSEISVGCGFYNDGYSNRPVATASYMYGFHFNERFFAGASASCSFSSYYGGYIYQGKRVYDDDFGIRLLANAKYTVLKKTFSPYVGLDLGAATVSQERFFSPYAGCQLGVRWIIKTHKVLGFCVEPGISTKGYSEVLFKLSFEFN